MIYLDYSATTPVNESVLDSFNKVCRDYIGNPNSLHKLGVDAKRLMDASCNQVADLLSVSSDEIIFTSGASESNNLAIYGVINRYKNRGKHIITTKLEHSSVLEGVSYLEKNGYIIDYVNILEDGRIDIDSLENLLSKDTILVSICEVNSEIGIIQDVNKIGEIIKKYPTCLFHVDGTQAIGKKKVSLKNIDLYSFSGHKIYGLKGIGVLYKRRGVEIDPIIHGGKSQTIYRSGTPSLALIVSMAKALKLMLEDLDNKINYVNELKNILINGLKDISDIHINSNSNCVSNIINVSVLNIKPETMLHALEEEDIYISTKTACSNNSSLSIPVFELTKNEDYANTSVRISLSYLTKKEDVNKFVEIFKNKIKELKIRG